MCIRDSFGCTHPFLLLCLVTLLREFKQTVLRSAILSVRQYVAVLPSWAWTHYRPAIRGTLSHRQPPLVIPCCSSPPPVQTQWRAWWCVVVHVRDLDTFQPDVLPESAMRWRWSPRRMKVISWCSLLILRSHIIQPKMFLTAVSDSRVMSGIVLAQLGLLNVSQRLL